MCQYFLGVCRHCHTIEQCHVDYCDPVREYLVTIEPPQPMEIHQAINLSPLENCTGVSIPARLLFSLCRHSIEWNRAVPLFQTNDFSENRDDLPLSPFLPAEELEYMNEQHRMFSALSQTGSAVDIAISEEAEIIEVEVLSETADLDEPNAESGQWSQESAADEEPQFEIHTITFGDLPETIIVRRTDTNARITLPELRPDTIPRREQQPPEPERSQAPRRLQGSGTSRDLA